MSRSAAGQRRFGLVLGATVTVDAKPFPVLVFFVPPVSPAPGGPIPIPYPNIPFASR